jgi:hypothetical protein
MLAESDIQSTNTMLSFINHLYTPCHVNNGLQLPNLQLEW